MNNCSRKTGGGAARVLVLGGGPDAEREVSVASAAAVAEALATEKRFEVRTETIGRIGRDELAAMPGDVLFPVLHGPWGEGGPLQELLQADGRPFVGCPAGAARTAMDKLATKQVAAQLGIPVLDGCAIDPAIDREMAASPLGLPVVVKPVFEGSSVGLAVCRTTDAWHRAVDAAAARSAGGRGPSMAEAYATGMEVTVGVVDGIALPLVGVAPARGVYDYAAKYQRQDTVYTVRPGLQAGVGEKLSRWSVALVQRIGASALARVDWIVGDRGPVALEINTTPGFTARSLLPMAAAAQGAFPAGFPGAEDDGSMAFQALCAALVDSAQKRKQKRKQKQDQKRVQQPAGARAGQGPGKGRDGIGV